MVRTVKWGSIKILLDTVDKKGCFVSREELAHLFEVYSLVSSLNNKNILDLDQPQPIIY